MEVDQIQCEFRVIGSGSGSMVSAKLGKNQKMEEQYAEEEEDGERKRGKEGGGVDLGSGVGRFYGWPSSRIVRVSRASGGKDRHSKVLTSKGLRDRRVRLSVNTAIQFYDLQDRLGYDQPSKAVEWLLKAAASSIAELPPMISPFPDSPKQVSDEKRSSTAAGSDQFGLESVEVDMDGCVGDPSYVQRQPVAAKSSACSSNSETSKGSGLSLSRSESRTKARERAKERAAEKEKEKEKDQDESSHVLNAISQTTSFTELLNGGFNNVHNRHSNSCIKSPRNLSSASMDYFTSGLLGAPVTRPEQMQFVNSFKPVASPLFSVSGEHHSDLQTFSFAPDQLVSVAGGDSNSSNNHHNGGPEYNLNFTISSASSSGLSGFNRGTLQSNSTSPSLLPPVQRFPPTDGSPPNFLIGTTAPVENHHQFLSGFDARLQLYYGDGHAHNGRHAGQKGKGKN